MRGHERASDHYRRRHEQPPEQPCGIDGTDAVHFSLPCYLPASQLRGTFSKRSAFACRLTLSGPSCAGAGFVSSTLAQIAWNGQGRCAFRHNPTKPHKVRFQTVRCRRTSVRSRLAALPECTISPRSRASPTELVHRHGWEIEDQGWRTSDASRKKLSRSCGSVTCAGRVF